MVYVHIINQSINQLNVKKRTKERKKERERKRERKREKKKKRKKETTLTSAQNLILVRYLSSYVLSSAVGTPPTEARKVLVKNTSSVYFC